MFTRLFSSDRVRFDPRDPHGQFRSMRSRLQPDPYRREYVLPAGGLSSRRRFCRRHTPLGGPQNASLRRHIIPLLERIRPSFDALCTRRGLRQVSGQNQRSHRFGRGWRPTGRDQEKENQGLTAPSRKRLAATPTELGKVGETSRTKDADPCIAGGPVFLHRLGLLPPWKVGRDLTS